MSAEFREVPGSAGYTVSRDGVVISPRGRQLAKWRNRGYLMTKLSRRAIAVHRAVALAWIPNPMCASDVNHIDGDKNNNDASNLEWCSRSENIRHALDTGLHGFPETPVIGYHPDTNRGIWARSQAEVRHFGFHQPLVNKCLKGERRHHRGFIWGYA